MPVATTPLDEVRSLLGGDAFLVPCIRGTKMPAVTYTQRPFEATQTPAYRFALASGEFNIAVYLGQMSGGLCALDFDRDEDLAAFLGVNPTLATTTRSRGSRGGMVWLRIEGEFPTSVTTERFEWRANGRLSTIYGQHPKGMDYTLLVAAPPVAVNFADIQWPVGWELPWVTAFKSGTLGTPKTESENGVPAVPSSPVADFGTLGTGNSELRARARVDSTAHIDIGEDFQEELKDSESAVPSVPSLGVEKPLSAAGERLPYLTPSGTLVIPFDSPEQYHWWKPDGERLSVAETLNEVKERMKHAVTV